MIEYIIIMCVITVGMLFMGVVALMSLLILYFALFGDLVIKRRLIEDHRAKWKE
jgi:hypothetical protein